MTGEQYRFVCHTCERDEIVRGINEAQGRFTEHAKQGCEVVINAVDADAMASPPSASESPDVGLDGTESLDG